MNGKGSPHGSHASARALPTSCARTSAHRSCAPGARRSSWTSRPSRKAASRRLLTTPSGRCSSAARARRPGQSPKTSTARRRGRIAEVGRIVAFATRSLGRQASMIVRRGICSRCSRSAAEETDSRNPGLPHLRGARLCDRRAGDERDEIGPPHAIPPIKAVALSPVTWISATWILSLRGPRPSPPPQRT